MKNYYVVLCFLMLGFLFTKINAQQSYTVKRGERPSIDLQALPDDAYEKGILKIKLDESFTNQMDNNPVIVDENGTVRFNIINIDQLNQQYGAKNFKKLFESKAFSPKFSERHRAWGFHLWYTLYFDEKTDINELVNAYEQLSEVSIAEPEYKKELVASRPTTFQTKIKGDDPGSPPVDWTPNDPYYNQQWHYHNTGQQSGTPDADIDLPEAWDIERGNSNVIVCIEDGGIQYNHPDLSGNMWSGLGWDFVNNDATIEPHYHGTHVAGTVAAESNNGTGVSGVAGGSGTNDGVRLMSCQVFTSSSSGGFHLAPIYAADNGACISQNSWTYTNPDSYDQVVLDAIDYFNANGGGSAMLNGGITIFAAANNNSSAHYYPAYYSGTFSVAATNNQDIKSYYSNYGTWVDISAPGGETNSVTARGIYSTYTGSSYAFLQGTSMACPHTSGVAGLIVSLAYGILTPTNVANIISSTTDDHYGVNPGYIGQLGTGRLNAYQALLETQNYMSGVLNPQTFTPTPVSASQINLAWTKNTSNNDVMIVWSLSSTIGTPVDGVAYTAGQTIPGGGTVLYRGSNTSYNHTSLNAATTYYYKAFSYNGSNQYSNGISANATTFCDAISSLPFTEDFSDGILPVCWENIDNIGNGQIWQFNNPGSRTINTSTSGNGFAILDSDYYGYGNNQDADLVTPLLDLSGYSTVNLYFEHYFRSYYGSSATLAYSINGGTSWTTIQTWTSSTTNAAIFNQDLTSQVAGQSNVKFRWKYVGSWGYYWAVDDVTVSGSGGGSAPVADFFADNTNPTIGQTVYFTDLSTNTPTSWLWAFNPTTITYVGGTNSSSQNPQVQFNVVSQYTVTLTATNTYGNDTETKTNYINATSSIPPYIDDFESYASGNYLAVQSPYWTTWTNQPGSSEDGYVSTNQALSGIQSVKVDGTTDLVLLLNDKTSGKYMVSFDMYIPSGYYGFFDLLQIFNGADSEWGMQVFFDAGGNGHGDANGENSISFSYSYNTWLQIDNVIDLDSDWAEFWFNGTLIHEWQWSKGAFGVNSINQLAGLNMYAWNQNGTPLFYFDDVNYYEVIQLDLNVLLEGPYNQGTGLMNTDLNVGNYIPLSQPYNVAPWNYNGTESVTSITDPTIVDWVLVELRDATSADQALASTIIDRKAVFLKNNGQVVDVGGNTIIEFRTPFFNSLFVVAYHLNHLGVISANGLTQTGSLYNYNFSTGAGQAHGGANAHNEIIPGIWGMAGGDGDRNGQVGITDKSPLWENEAGTKGYLPSDYNLDSESDNKDKNDVWLPNNGMGSQVPE